MYEGSKIIFVPSAKVENSDTGGCEALDYQRLCRLAKAVGAEYFDTDRLEFPGWVMAGARLRAAARKAKTFA